MSLSEAVTLLAVTDRVLPAVESLGEALGITRDALVATLARGRLEPFEALGRAVALNEHVHVSLVEAICRRWRRTAPDRRSILGRYGRVTEAMIDAELRPLKPAAPRAATTTRIFDIAAESAAAS